MGVSARWRSRLGVAAVIAGALLGFALILLSQHTVSAAANWDELALAFPEAHEVGGHALGRRRPGEARGLRVGLMDCKKGDLDPPQPRRSQEVHSRRHWGLLRVAGGGSPNLHAEESVEGRHAHSRPGSHGRDRPLRHAGPI